MRDALDISQMALCCLSLTRSLVSQQRAFRISRAIGKLRQLLPENDQCVPMDDPLTTVLDQIQAGDLENATVRYFSSRVRAGELEDDAVNNAVGMVGRSFAAFKARRAEQEASFAEKLEALRAVLVDGAASPDIVAIAASTGLSGEPLSAAQAIFTTNSAAIPTSVVAWIDWIVAFFAADEHRYLSLLGDDADIVNYVVRGKKKGGPPTAEEFAYSRPAFGPG